MLYKINSRIVLEVLYLDGKQMNNMKIRKVEIKDFEKCIELFHDENLECVGGEYFRLEWLYDYLDEDLFLVAEENEEVLGAILGENLKQMV